MAAEHVARDAIGRTRLAGCKLLDQQLAAGAIAPVDGGDMSIQRARIAERNAPRNQAARLATRRRQRDDAALADGTIIACIDDRPRIGNPDTHAVPGLGAVVVGGLYLHLVVALVGIRVAEGRQRGADVDARFQHDLIGEAVAPVHVERDRVARPGIEQRRAGKRDALALERVPVRTQLERRRGIDDAHIDQQRIPGWCVRLIGGGAEINPVIAAGEGGEPQAR